MQQPTRRRDTRLAGYVMENDVMSIGKLFHTITQQRGKTRSTEHEIARLRAENRLLRSAVAEASEALTEAPLWHMQHRVARNILIDAKEEIAHIEAVAAHERRPAVKATRRPAAGASVFNRIAGADC